jgi:hypothetical protein
VKGRLAVIVIVFCVSATAGQAATVIPGFRSPTGNIACLLVPGPPASIMCNLAHAGYAKTLQDRCHSSASLDWHGFQLLATKAGSTVCSGGILYSPGTQHPRYVTLAYGRTWQHGTFTCTSRVTGVTCRNGANHGLFVSRESWRTW